MKVRFERVEKDRPVLRPQARQHSQEHLGKLADSLINPGQLQPIGMLSKDNSVIWGAGRVLASRMRPQITHLLAAILDEEISEQQVLKLRFIENQHRQDLSNYEKAITCVEYLKSNPALTNKQVAEDLHVDQSLITRWLAIDKCIGPVRKALSEDRITLVTMYAISQKPQTEQLAELETALNGKKRGSNGNAVVRSKLYLPSGVEFTVAASQMSLQGLRDALRDLTKLAEEAKDVETLAEAMKIAKSEGVTDLDVLTRALKSAKELDQELDLRTLMSVARGKKAKK